MFKKTGLLLFILLLCGLSGCGRTASASGQEEQQITDISSMEAETLSIAGNIQEAETLRENKFTLEDEEIFARHVVNLQPGNHAGLESVFRNTDFLFYHISYSKDMAQYTYRNQIYMRSLEGNEDVLLHDTSDAYWLNEICANNTYLYWVEYVSSETSDSEEVCFKVMQCQLDNGNISCIAERDGAEFSEICLEVSDHFLTWYDIHMRDSVVELVVFDIEKQMFQEHENTDPDIPGLTVTLYNPYEKLRIVENCITYFMRDDQEQLYIRRENLHTGATDTFLLGETKPYHKIGGCFSDSRYIGWHTEYGEGDYYFYDTSSKKLLCWNVKTDDMYVFSKFFCRGKLYFNNTDDHNIYVWDLPTGQVYRQNCGEDAYWIRTYGDDNLLYLGTSSIDTAGCCSLHSGD